MKNFLLIITCFLLLSCSNSTPPVGEDYQVILTSTSSDVLLKNIQQKISNAFVASIATGDNMKPLSELDQQLSAQYKKSPQKLILYWRAYLHFYKSICHLQKKENDQAEKATDQAIKWITNMKKANSEDLALLSMLQGFSIQFKSGIKAPFIGGKAEKNGNKAITLDKENLRGWYVLASSDFYTPEQFGGGKKTEEYLLKAIACPDQKIKNEYLPSWGREEAYEMLIKFYMRKENWDKAKQSFSKANELFPNSYQINQLAPKLIGK